MSNVSLEPVDTVPITITLHIPRKVQLPVQIDPINGEPWPSAGVALSRVFNAQDLIEAGITVEWALPDGTPVPPDVALALIIKHTEMISEGYAIPNFTAVEQPSIEGIQT